MPTGQGNHKGYLLIDNRYSPGVSEEFVRASGKDAIAVPGGTTFEADTFTCSHCNAIVVKNPERTRERAVCRKCCKVVCDSCVGECIPFAKVLEDLQSQAYHLEVRGLTAHDRLAAIPPSLTGMLDKKR